jgi:pimeloyl-ACP methyl ester carboxylesterase
MGEDEVLDRVGTFVLVHGAFHGGWCWRRVADRLLSSGYRVYTPTQTGLGERAHLLDASVGLDTFIQDVVGLIEAEELEDVVLVGHSFGGISITGAADRLPEPLRHLVYLDAFIVEDGGTALDLLPRDVAAERMREAEEHSGGLAMRPFPASAFGVSDEEDAAWVNRRLTPHPLKTYTDRLVLNNPIGNGRPCTYLVCTAPLYPPTESSRRWAAAREGWDVREIPSGHGAMIISPEKVVEILLKIADEPA